MHASWMNVHECFDVDEGARSKSGPRNLNARVNM